MLLLAFLKAKKFLNNLHFVFSFVHSAKRSPSTWYFRKFHIFVFPHSGRALSFVLLFNFFCVLPLRQNRNRLASRLFTLHFVPCLCNTRVSFKKFYTTEACTNSNENAGEKVVGLLWRQHLSLSCLAKGLIKNLWQKCCRLLRAKNRRHSFELIRC